MGGEEHVSVGHFLKLQGVVRFGGRHGLKPIGSSKEGGPFIVQKNDAIPESIPQL